ncbi:MAG TPA: META domain-containing protein [Pseudonocardiaceae bacterium]
MKRIGALAALLVLAGCAGGTTDTPGGAGPGTGGTSADDLTGRKFVSTEITEAGAPRPLAAGTRISLQFTDDGRLLAHAGCNNLQGPVRLTDGKLGVTDLSMTEMGCEKPLHEQDTWLAGFLGEAPTVVLDGVSLRLTAGETVMVLADREVAQPDVPFEDTTWTLDTILLGDTAASAPAGSTATLRFSGGTVEVHTGCNTGTGTYQVNGDTLTIGELALTRKGCLPDLAQVEQAMTSALAATPTFTVDADRLTLKTPEGGIALRATG